MIETFGNCSAVLVGEALQETGAAAYGTKRRGAFLMVLLQEFRVEKELGHLCVLAYSRIHQGSWRTYIFFSACHVYLRTHVYTQYVFRDLIGDM